MREHGIDELLEAVWTLEEEGRATKREVLSHTGEDSREILKEALQGELVIEEADKILLTPAGRKRAEAIIRRHRLAERLLSEVFEVSEEESETHACRFEHLLSKAVTEGVCAFLGHPPTCPHGKPIPTGECCVKFGAELKPLVFPLTELAPGEKAKIVFMGSKHHSRIDRMSSLGFIPGSVIKLHQKKPSYVVQLGETDLALDENICREIYVRKLY